MAKGLPEAVLAERNRDCVDVFCDCHHYTEPNLLMDGMDVAWPADLRQAQEWRPMQAY